MGQPEKGALGRRLALRLTYLNQGLLVRRIGLSIELWLTLVSLGAGLSLGHRHRNPVSRPGSRSCR